MRSHNEMITRCGRENSPAILLLAGFGDDSSMFSRLCGTRLGSLYRLLAMDLPGFGAAHPLECETTLSGLASIVAHTIAVENAPVVVGHSLSSLIASLAVRDHGAEAGVISLEGNLTSADAYFSGSAADHDEPGEFREAFLRRLSEMADNAILERYLAVVARADPRALWELGCDARRFSVAENPGDVLRSLDRAYYIYNPVNCPAESIEWLERSSLPRIRLEDASHWAAVDQPDAVAGAIERVVTAWSVEDQGRYWRTRYSR